MKNNNLKKKLNSNQVTLGSWITFQSDLDEIVRIDGIDGLIIAPYDLSASIGHPGEIERAEMKEMIEKFQRTCIKAGKAFGEHIVHPDKIKLNKTIESGARFIAFGTDFNFMIKGLEDEFRS